MPLPTYSDALQDGSTVRVFIPEYLASADKPNPFHELYFDGNWRWRPNMPPIPLDDDSHLGYLRGSPSCVVKGSQLYAFITQHDEVVAYMPTANGSEWVNQGRPPGTSSLGNVVSVSASPCTAFVIADGRDLWQLDSPEVLGRTWTRVGGLPDGVQAAPATDPNQFEIANISAVRLTFGEIVVFVGGTDGHIYEFRPEKGALSPPCDRGTPWGSEPSPITDGKIASLAAWHTPLVVHMKPETYGVCVSYCNAQEGRFCVWCRNPKTNPWHPEEWMWWDVKPLIADPTQRFAVSSAAVTPSGTICAFGTDNGTRLWVYRSDNGDVWEVQDCGEPPTHGEHPDNLDCHRLWHPSAVATSWGYVGAFVADLGDHVFEAYGDGSISGVWRWAYHGYIGMAAELAA